MTARRWLQICLVLLIASGCAQRADWIESMLVTVDVTGQWTGELAVGASGGEFHLTLRQTGPKATGDVTCLCTSGHFWSGPIVGTVSGDLLTLSRPDGLLQVEMIVAGDEMSGTVTFTHLTASSSTPQRQLRTLRLQRQPGGRPESH
jgi:hypothetical protein